jgi:plastocyanin
MIMRTIILSTIAVFFSITLKAQTAEVQIIHNSADAAAATVDVYLDGALIGDDFPFRQATAFLSVPAEQEIVVGIAPSTSTSVNDTIAAFAYTLAANEKYIIVANGIVSGSGYSPAPDFDLYVYPMARDAATSGSNTDVLVFHGSTDAPTVDIYETAVVGGELINDLMYGDFFGYAELPTNDYILEVRDETGMTTVAKYTAPLSTLGLDGAAISVLASGFLNPANNSDGEAFGLWVALASGGALVELPEIKEAQVQIIHNSADAAAEMVDIYLGSTLIEDDFMFRTATEFLTVPAEEDIVVGIAPSTSTSVDDTIASFTYNLTQNEKYIIVANGIVSGSGYTPNQAFDLYVAPMARDMASSGGNTDVLVFHGSTDAPTVDIYETAVVGGELINDLMYGDFFGYAELATNDYILEVRDETGTTKVAAYQAPLATLGLDDAAITVVASGFLNPANNSDGEAFGLWVALSSGGALVELPLYEPEAQVQIIHNSADAAAEMVDVYLDGALIGDDFMFRTATEFLTVPAEQDIVVGIAPSNSTSVNDTIASFTYNLTADEKYIIVANGIVSGSGYDPAEAFDLYVFPMARDMAASSGNTDVLVFHGSTDAPTVDIYETTVVGGELINNLMYSDFFGYVELATNDYVLEVRDETGTATVAAYQAPLATLGLDDAAITVLASGFLNPANNSDGEAFGLYVALATGGALVELPLVEENAEAMVQIIHNSADAAAEMVDVYLDGVLIGDDFMFRTATEFLAVPAEQDIVVGIAPSNSTSVDDTIASFTYNLVDGNNYILIANGLLDLATDYTIGNSGFTFTPETLVVSVGDQVTFDVGSMHPVVEVDADTWMANGTTPLSGGFAAPNGNETIVFTEPGTYYYVCENHVSQGMKGIITVTENTFDISVYDMGRMEASTSGNTDVLVYHGAVDAPTVDIYETAVVGGELINDLMYGEFFGYAELATSDYVLEIRDETGMEAFVAYQAPLSTLGLNDAAITVVASGFVEPENFNSETNFGLFVALSSGGALVELPMVEENQEAMVQIIHNSADAAAEMVDVYLDGVLIGDDFMFRTASEFLTVPAEQNIVVGIAPSTSTSVNDTIASFTYNLSADEKYIIIANGIVSATGYDPAEAFDLYVFPMARDMATSSGNTDVLVFHGSTDAPTVDIYETAVVDGELIDNLMYGDFFGYAELATNNYVLEVRDETGMNTVAAYEAPLSTLGLDGAAITVLASGFLNPANNSDGEAFGLWVALASGGALVELPQSTGIFDNANYDFEVSIYPVPASTQITVKAEQTVENASVINAQGQIINTISGNGTNQLVLDINNLVPGTYFISVQSTNQVSVERFIKQ